MEPITLDQRDMFFSPELQALVAGVQGKGPSSDPDWEKLEQLALVHGVAPLLHRAWRDSSGTVPSDLLRSFKRYRQQTLLQSLFALRQRDALLRTLAAAGIPCLVLKGAALARSWYDDLSLRHFVDIDILLPANDLGRARDLLLADEYEEVRQWQAPHHGRPFHRPGLPCTVELHRSLTRLSGCEDLGYEEFRPRAMAPMAESGVLWTLGPEDTLVHLCLHLLSHLDYDHGWQLRHLCDIAHHLDAFVIDWPSFRERAQVLGVGRACRVVLGLAALVLDANVPREDILDEAVFGLVSYPVPGPIDHRMLAAFLVALRRLDLRQAFHLLLGRCGPGASKARYVRTHAISSSARRVLRESIQAPGQLRRQLQIWSPEAHKGGEREHLLAQLTAGRGSATR